MSEHGASAPEPTPTEQLAAVSLSDPPTQGLYRASYVYGEDRELYIPGGYHPVHLGDTLGEDHRYRVHYKLRYSESATVWLCRDVEVGEYVSVKIMVANKSSEDCPELKLMKLMEQEELNFMSGGDRVDVPHDHFWINGPNGTHLCLVSSVGLPLVDVSSSLDIRAELSSKFALQVVQGLEFLHKNGICHGGFKLSNVLLKLFNFDFRNEVELEDIFREPTLDPILTTSGASPGPGAPGYIVKPIRNGDIDPFYLSDQLCITDFGEPYGPSNPSAGLDTPMTISSPKLIFGKPIEGASDIWALGCILHKIKYRRPVSEMQCGTSEVEKCLAEFFGNPAETSWESWEGGDHWRESNLINNPSWENDHGEKIGILKKWYAEGLAVSDEAISAMPEDELDVYMDLLVKMLMYDPRDRITIESVKDHPWFSGEWREDKKEEDLSDEKSENLEQWDGEDEFPEQLRKPTSKSSVQDDAW